MPNKAAAVLKAALARLGARGVEEAGLNAQWLLADALGLPRLRLLADLSVPVPAEALAKFERGLAEKESGLPLAYILGWQDFRGLRLKVDGRVLVPRPETEELAGFAAAYLRTLAAPKKIMDYGAGSGAIGLWLAKEFPSLKVTAAEKSARAIACARENADALGLAARVTFRRTATPAPLRGPYDLIVSNPPYIPTSVIPGLSPEVLSEPKVALDGGGDGLGIARLLARLAPARLRRGGALLLELGGGQAAKLLAELPESAWKGKKLRKDFNGIERFMFAIKR